MQKHGPLAPIPVPGFYQALPESMGAIMVFLIMKLPEMLAHRTIDQAVGVAFFALACSIIHGSLLRLLSIASTDA